MNNHTKGFFLVFISAFCFSILPILGKIAYSFGLSPLTLLAWRFLLAAITIWLIAPFIVGKSLLVKKIDLLHFAIQGVIGYGLASIGYFTALAYLNASLVSILLYLYPAIVAVLSRIVFKERLTKLRILVVFLTFCGSLLITNIFQASTGNIHWKGILFGLLAAFAYSIFNLYGQRNTAKFPPLVVSTYSLTALAIFFLAIAPHREFLHINLASLGLAALIGVVSTVLPIVTYLAGIKLIGAGKAAIISTFEPAFTIILAFIFLAESLTILQSCGAVLIIAGVLALQFQKTPQPVVELPTPPAHGQSHY